MKLIFMGTPDYSVPTLKALIDAGHDVEAVFCQPDKPVGRKKVLTAPAVKVFAQQMGIKVYQPDSVKTDEVFDIITEIAPECIVVVAYGKILPERILNFPKYGCINGHASILPKYRGSAPIQWAIVCGEKETGVTAMYMDRGVDTGDILDIEKVEIESNENAGQLFSKLSFVTASLLLKVLDNAKEGKLVAKKQNEEEATYAPMIKKEMALIDFNKEAQEIVNAIRGFNPWPVAYCFLDSKRLKVFSAEVAENKEGVIGSVVENQGKLTVLCANNTAISFGEVQIEGGKRMSASDFLKGNKIPVGTLLLEGEKI